MHKQFRRTAKIALVLVYLVIAAGAIVRMTGSGMGCPDWPKCFGHYIPPTHISELQWKAETEIKKGQVIIVDETLQVAVKDFRTAASYNENNWKTYTKHDYAEFNVSHTWVEYVNRLFGALAGFATLILALLSFSSFRKNKILTILSWLVVFGMGFQAWLGATVVYSVLEPVKITAHMIMALVIVALLLYIIHLTRKTVVSRDSKNIIPLLGIVLFATLVQIILGTQVRQFVDERIDTLGETANSLWLANVNWEFYAHRSFSILVVILNILLALRIHKSNFDLTKMNWVLVLLFFEIISGVVMYYFDFPFATQSIHLILATLIFGVQFYLVLEATSSRKRHKSL